MRTKYDNSCEINALTASVTTAANLIARHVRLFVHFTNRCLGFQVGQFVPELYARYFEFPNLEAAQEDVDERMAASRKAVEGNADDSMGDNSWFARQMKDRKGDRVRAKGRQLRDHVTLEHVKQIHAFQRHSCHYSGETVFLARGGKYSPHAGCVELVSATSRAAKIAGSWLARGFNRAPLEARFAFLEYWGMDGRRYLAYLKPTGRGSFDDPLEAKSLEILGQDRSGNLLAQNSEGEGGQSLSGEETSGARSREEEAGGPAKLEEPAGELRRAVSALPSVPPLPFGGLHGSWGTIGGCLDELTAEKPPPSPRYRRRGLTIDGAPRALTSLRNSHSTRARDDADLPGADSNLSGRGEQKV